MLQICLRRVRLLCEFSGVCRAELCTREPAVFRSSKDGMRRISYISICSVYKHSKPNKKVAHVFTRGQINVQYSGRENHIHHTPACHVVPEHPAADHRGVISHRLPVCTRPLPPGSQRAARAPPSCSAAPGCQQPLIHFHAYLFAHSHRQQSAPSAARVA